MLRTLYGIEEPNVAGVDCHTRHLICYLPVGLNFPAQSHPHRDCTYGTGKQVISCLIAAHKKCKIAHVVKLCCRAVGHMTSTLLFPLLPFLFQVAVLGYFLTLSVYIFSIGQSTYKVVGPDNTQINCSCPLVIVIYTAKAFTMDS